MICWLFQKLTFAPEKKMTNQEHFIKFVTIKSFQIDIKKLDHYKQKLVNKTEQVQCTDLISALAGLQMNDFSHVAFFRWFFILLVKHRLDEEITDTTNGIYIKDSNEDYTRWRTNNSLQ